MAGTHEDFELVDAHDRFQLLQRLAREHGINGFFAQGENGQVLGPTGDAVVFRVYAERRSWARESVAECAAALDAGGTYFDIGANIGLTTIELARLPGVRCVAFEPDEENHAFLVRNIALNVPDRDVRLERVALSNKNGTLQFERSAKQR